MGLVIRVEISMHVVRITTCFGNVHIGTIALHYLFRERHARAMEFPSALISTRTDVIIKAYKALRPYENPTIPARYAAQIAVIKSDPSEKFPTNQAYDLDGVPRQ